MLAIVADAVVLCWPASGVFEFAELWPTVAILPLPCVGHR
jgi:hypothetical protein